MKKGDYVVLLAGCDGRDPWINIPINYVYQLRTDFSIYDFKIVKDIKGSKTNGWDSKDKTYPSKLKVRLVTPNEIEKYQIKGRPVPAESLNENETKNELKEMENIDSILEGIYSNPELRRSVVPLFLGNPGLGKTALIEGFARKKGVKLIEFITSQMSPFEVSGIGMPDAETKKMVYYNFDKLDSLEDGDILFFDELLNGNPTVLAACLTILEGRRMISGKALPDIMIVAAANEQGAAPIPPQVKERFVWYNIKFCKKLWGNYMKNKYKITPLMIVKLSKLIEAEEFKLTNNFHTPRSIDKAINMIINEVPTPYDKLITPILSELVSNSYPERIELKNGEFLEPNETLPWLKLIKYYNETTRK